MNGLPETFGKMNPLEQFEQAVRSLCPRLDEEAGSFLNSGLVVRTIKRKDFFIQAGNIQHEIGFVVSGLMRGFYVDEKGNEITIRFIAEGGYVTHYSSFITQQASKYSFQCLEPTEVVCLSYDHIQEGYRRHISLERYGRLIAEEVLKAQQKRIEGFQFEDAEQRYMDFIEQYPGLFQRISLSHLSSYLGIARPSLSRIRKKMQDH